MIISLVIAAIVLFIVLVLLLFLHILPPTPKGIMLLFGFVLIVLLLGLEPKKNDDVLYALSILDGIVLSVLAPPDPKIKLLAVVMGAIGTLGIIFFFG